MNSKSTLRSVLSLGAALALFAGCASSDSTPQTQVQAGMSRLAKGLSAQQVRELLGAPASTRPFNAAGVAGQIWAYPVRHDTATEAVAVANKEVPAINPRTGQEITRLEPVYQNQTTETTDTLHLLIVGDQLVEWRVVRKDARAFD